MKQGFFPDTKKEYIPTYQELCTEICIFNTRYPVGSWVIVEKDEGIKVTTRVRHPAKIIGDTPVVWLNGISGCYAMDRVEGAPGENPKTMLAPDLQEFPAPPPVPPIETPRKNLMKFLEDNKLKLTDEQESLANRLFSIPRRGGKSFLVAMLYHADRSAQLYANWMEREEKWKKNGA